MAERGGGKTGTVPVRTIAPGVDNVRHATVARLAALAPLAAVEEAMTIPWWRRRKDK